MPFDSRCPFEVFGSDATEPGAAMFDVRDHRFETPAPKDRSSAPLRARPTPVSPTHARNGVRAVLMLAESERGREIGPGIPDDLLEFGVQFRLKGSLSNAEARRVKCSPVGTATPEP